MSDNGNGNAAHALREAARRKVYRELKFSDFDPTREGSILVRVSLTHGEQKRRDQWRDEFNVKIARLRELPNGEESETERAFLEQELRSLADEHLAFFGSLIVDSGMQHPEGMSREEILGFFRGDNDDQDPKFEEWLLKKESEMVEEYREQNFTKPKAG